MSKFDLKSIDLNKEIKFKKKKQEGGKYLAIHFTTLGICFAIGEYKNNKLNLEKTFYEEVEENIFENGKILDKEKLIEFIKKALFKEKVDITNTVVTIESTEFLRRELTVADVAEEDLDSLVGFELNHALPMDLTNFIVQYKTAEKIKLAEMDKQMINVCAMPKSIGEELYSVLKESELVPKKLDINSNSIEKLINMYEENKDKTIAVIDIEGTYIKINIYKKGSNRFNRIIKLEEMDFSTLTKLNQEILDENGDLNFSVDKLMNDLDMVFRFYTSRNSVENKIDEIVLCGSTSEIEGIEQFFENRLNIKIVNFENTESIVKDENIKIGKYANAIGVLINIGSGQNERL